MDMKGGLSGLMKQAQQIQENMQKAQEELARAEVEGQSGGGMVKVVMTGRHEVRSIKLDDSLLSEDRDMLEDLIVAAVNDAVNRVGKMMEERFAGMTAGMSLPPGMKLPF
jgi:DNA-binding YbaB/EbfC family protein